MFDDAFAASLEHERWVRDRAQMILDGEERGLAKGIEQGQIKERRATVAKMLAEGLPEELIQRVTGLSPAELAELRTKL